MMLDEVVTRQLLLELQMRIVKEARDLAQQTSDTLGNTPWHKRTSDRLREIHKAIGKAEGMRLAASYIEEEMRVRGWWM